MPYSPGNSGKYAAVEAASAVGLYRLDREERNALRTTSYGVGKVMREAIEAGCTELIAAVGGVRRRATAARACSPRWDAVFDGQNRLIDYPPAATDTVRCPSTRPPLPPYARVPVQGIVRRGQSADGPKGAAAVFAPQKGPTRLRSPYSKQERNNFAAKAAAATGTTAAR